MMENDLEIMNYYMNRVTQEIFSYFDVGSGETGLEETERFYHGFVLGLMAEQAENYVLKSNRESGFGRYDVMMRPKKENLPAIILEFKVHRPKKEKEVSDLLGGNQLQWDGQQINSDGIFRGKNKDGRTAARRRDSGKF